MRRVINYSPFIIIFLIFKNWFIFEKIIGGDWPYFFSETLRDFPLFPPSWSSLHGNGLGGVLPDYFINQYLYFTSFVSLKILNVPWEIGYKIFWFGGFLWLSIYSSIYLAKTAFQNKIEAWQMSLAALLYTSNTYILMVVGGGQMGIGLAYSVAPLVLARFIKIIHNSEFPPTLKFRRAGIIHNSVLAGLVLAVQVMFDPRIAYITMAAILLYYFVSNIHNLLSWKILSLLPPLLFAILLNAFWVFPFVAFRSVSLPEGFASTEGFKFFSFADFSRALSLLHPNWPENIFGKTYFLQPEFLLLPILAYSSLLFISKIKFQKSILFFALLGLVGAFLAKGANEPFGELNVWMFEYIPGMNMFRDPTKFYILIALSYSVLIPFSTHFIYKWLSSKLEFGVKSYLPKLFLLFTILYSLFLIRPLWLGELEGTFARHEVPREYMLLKDFLNDQPDFFRTLWMPRQQRFSFTSYNHPAVEVDRLLGASNSAEMIEQLEKKETQKMISEKSIKYIVVPYDSLGEIFLDDRKYDEKQYQNVIKQLSNISWLKKIEGFGKIAVFEVSEKKDHFWLEGEGDISFKMVNPAFYSLTVRVTKPTNIIYSEIYSPYWVAKSNSIIIESKKTSNNLNSFYLSSAGEYNLEVYFVQNQYYIYGQIIAFTSVGIILLVLVMLRFRTFL